MDEGEPAPPAPAPGAACTPTPNTMSAPNTVSSNTRATRSRFSSPQIPAAAANGATDSSSASRAQGSGTGSSSGSANGVEGQKTFMQRWLEPPVQVKASYQDAGLVRQGVFENMAPLGTLPKVGIFKKTAPPPAAAPEAPLVRKIVIINPKPSMPATPVPAPPPAPAPEEDETEDETEEEETDDGQTEDQNEEDKDEPADREDLKPRTAAAAAAAAQRSRRSMTSGETDDEEWAPGTSTAQKARTRRSMSRASTAPLQQPAAGAGAGSRQADQREFIDKVVEAAVDEALAHFRYPTAWALRTLYDENSSNQEFLNMMQKVFFQTANADTLEEFARLVQAKKKEGKRDNKACYYFVPPTTNSRVTPHKPKRAPYGGLVKFDTSALRLDRLDRDDAGKSQKRERPAKAPEPEPEAEPEPEPERDDAEPEPELPRRKKRKTGGKQHSAATSSAKATKMTAAANGVNRKSNAETPSRKRGRARSVSSISSLSSARSLSPPPEDGPEDGEDGGFDETPSRTSPVPPQPITATKRRRSNAPRKSRNVSPSRPSSAVSTTTTTRAHHPAAAATSSSQPSQRQSPAADQPVALAEEQPYEMPAVVDSPLFPSLNSKKGSKSGTPTLIFATKLGKIDPKDPKLRLRRQARMVTNQSFAISDIRDDSSQLASEQEQDEPEEPVRPTTPATAPASRPRTSLPFARPTPAPREGRSTRSALKRTHDDLEDQPSPTAAYFPGSEVASTAADSRAGTPALRPAKKPRTGLRVKNS